MSERTSKNPGIADYVVARRKHKDCFLDKIDRLIDWKPLEKLLRKKLQRVVNAVGNPAYSPLPMFKILLLQRWYNLSDVAAEESLYDRLSFVRFVGLSLDHDEVPDSSTICRLRQSLLEKNVLKRLLDKLNHQLERRGLLVRGSANTGPCPSWASSGKDHNRSATRGKPGRTQLLFREDRGRHENLIICEACLFA